MTGLEILRSCGFTDHMIEQTLAALPACTRRAQSICDAFPDGLLGLIDVAITLGIALGHVAAQTTRGREGRALVLRVGFGVATWQAQAEAETAETPRADAPVATH